MSHGFEMTEPTRHPSRATTNVPDPWVPQQYEMSEPV
jgi:hypothetical protein